MSIHHIMAENFACRCRCRVTRITTQCSARVLLGNKPHVVFELTDNHIYRIPLVLINHSAPYSAICHLQGVRTASMAERE